MLRNSKQPSTLMRFRIGDSARSKTMISPDGMVTLSPSAGSTPDGQVAGADQSLVVPVHEVGGIGGAHHGTRLSRHLTPLS